MPEHQPLALNAKQIAFLYLLMYNIGEITYDEDNLTTMLNPIHALIKQQMDAKYYSELPYYATWVTDEDGIPTNVPFDIRIAYTLILDNIEAFDDAVNAYLITKEPTVDTIYEIIKTYNI